MSVIDLAVSAAREVTIEEVNEAIQQAADGAMSGVLAVTAEPLVSVDLTHRTESSIVALPQTDVIDGRMVRVLAGSDNVWSVATRMADHALAMAKLISRDRPWQDASRWRRRRADVGAEGYLLLRPCILGAAFRHGWLISIALVVRPKWRLCKSFRDRIRSHCIANRPH